MCSFLFSYLWRNFNNVLEEFPNSEINIVLAVKGVYCRSYCFYFSLNFQPQNGSKSIPWLPLHFHLRPGFRGKEFNEFSHGLSLFLESHSLSYVFSIRNSWRRDQGLSQGLTGLQTGHNDWHWLDFCSTLGKRLIFEGLHFRRSCVLPFCLCICHCLRHCLKGHICLKFVLLWGGKV